MDFLNFLKDYYYLMVLILAFVILVLELILSFRVKPNQNILNFIDKIVPQLVIEAEEKFGSGSGASKLSFCIFSVKDAISRVFAVKNLDAYESYITKAVELILSTPQKKEGD